ncbi:MAG: 2-methylcitrate dehydratase [Natronomonas sp.]|jgi:2-methylcitrate dehydratase
MPSAVDIAGFAAEVSYEELPDEVREAAKRRVLDAVGVALGSLDVEPTDGIRRAVASRGDATESRLWGSGRQAAPADAAMYNAALTEAGNRATYLAPTLSSAAGPIPAVLAAAEVRSAPGEDLLAGLAAAHEVHGELAWNAPLDGFHPATHTAIAAAAGAGRAMGFPVDKLTSAVGLAASRGTLGIEERPFDPVAVGSAARSGLEACLLAEGGVIGPDSFTAEGGWTDLVGDFDLDLDPGCERVRDAAIRPYAGHPHAQAAIEAALNVAEDTAFDPADIDDVSVETYAEAVPEIDARAIAAALVDRDVTVHPGERADLRPVADTVEITSTDYFDERVGIGELPARVTVTARDGAKHEAEVQWPTGHPAKPASWGVVEEKFHVLADAYDTERRTAIVDTVRSLEAETAAELSRLLD